MTGVYTALIVLILWLVTMTIVSMILRYRRGMKPKNYMVFPKKCPECGREDCPAWLSLLSQENDDPTEERN